MVQVGFHLVNHEKKKGSHGGRGGHGLAEKRPTMFVNVTIKKMLAFVLLLCLAFITPLLTMRHFCGLAANSAGARRTRAKRGHRDGLPGDLLTVD